MESNEVMIETAEIKRTNWEKGVTTVEYAVMLVLVAVAVLALGSGFNGKVTDVFNHLAANLK